MLDFGNPTISSEEVGESGNMDPSHVNYDFTLPNPMSIINDEGNPSEVNYDFTKSDSLSIINDVKRVGRDVRLNDNVRHYKLKNK